MVDEWAIRLRLAERTCDTSTVCWNCGLEMQPEHAHYRCRACGWRDSCCDGPY